MIHIYTRTNIYNMIHIYTRTYIHNMCIYIDENVHAFVLSYTYYIQICTCMNKYMNDHTYKSIYACTCMYTCICTHTFIHANTHIFTRTQVHTHKLSLSLSLVLSLCLSHTHKALTHPHSLSHTHILFLTCQFHILFLTDQFTYTPSLFDSNSRKFLIFFLTLSSWACRIKRSTRCIHSPITV